MCVWSWHASQCSQLAAPASAPWQTRIKFWDASRSDTVTSSVWKTKNDCLLLLCWYTVILCRYLCELGKVPGALDITRGTSPAPLSSFLSKASFAFHCIFLKYHYFSTFLKHWPQCTWCHADILRLDLSPKSISVTIRIKDLGNLLDFLALHIFLLHFSEAWQFMALIICYLKLMSWGFVHAQIKPEPIKHLMLSALNHIQINTLQDKTIPNLTPPYMVFTM